MCDKRAMYDQRVVLGHINGLFGVRGWVKVYSHTRPMDNLLRYKWWYLAITDEGRQGIWRPFHVVEARTHGKTLVAQLANENGDVIDDRDSAVALLETDIAVARSDMPELPPDEFYWHDLVGLEVFNRDGECFGQVAEMMETGANDVLVVEGDHQRLIPFVFGVIVDDVDLEAGRITVDWGADF